MAGDWIKMRTNLRSDPAVIAAAVDLRIDRDLVVGKLHRLWCWGGDYCDGNGFAGGVTFAAIDAEIECPGLCESLARSAWMREEKPEVRGDNAIGVTFVGWRTHYSKSATARA